MLSEVLQIRWHYDADNDYTPIYSADFQHSGRIATCGGDNNIRIWRLYREKESCSPKVEYLSTLSRHLQAVNVVRFDPTGERLASAGDEGIVFIWVPSDKPINTISTNNEDMEIAKEFWRVNVVCRSPCAETYDLSWSPDGNYIVTGSMDNILRIYNANTGQLLKEYHDHLHYIQGVCWDPFNEYLVSQSSDRSICVYKIAKTTLNTSSIDLTHKTKLSRLEYPSSLQGPEQEEDASCNIQPKDSPTESKKSTSLFHGETLVTFFRRPAFSPDGSLLITPTGVYKDPNQNKTDTSNSVHVFTRSGLNSQPAITLSGFNKPAVVVRFSPILYTLKQTQDVSNSVLEVPYYMVFAVATQDAVFFYDTQSMRPFSCVVNLHYSTLTDLAWDESGRTLFISSLDGFCSTIMFDDDELGIPLPNAHVYLPQKLHDKSNSGLEAKTMTEPTILANSSNAQTIQTKKGPKKRIAPTLISN
ncbi:CAF assembly factor complex subunit B [Schizosaccharomyces japonicus yFS275]|uniref:CAF assembly factor complex subunit B n=1 Tax=Schizosaccharomyces japonicus (strain yFS275 / FY16936) TaxID=402676 RepID=B6K1T6_SCHJY|nr:CAF assembly factor complex subunit B [Schizosaccharomyces japonicus yFS275]EEB07117.1 CAF assembly factor complex subunit B [Schizosaccharomyces japonicus yFS275]